MLYVISLSDYSPLLSRFKQPLPHLQSRRETERWLLDKFMEKGGRPEASYPYYSVVGTSSSLEQHSLNYNHGIEKISIPISMFNEDDITFTYPDSMVSYSIWRDKPADHYQADYHGHVFTLSELETRLIHHSAELFGEKWTFSGEVMPYFEAQIWNHKKIYELVSELARRA